MEETTHSIFQIAKELNILGNELTVTVSGMLQEIDVYTERYFDEVFYPSEIKNDMELISSFEGILCLLIELKDKKSAVLLDEFRIH